MKRIKHTCTLLAACWLLSSEVALADHVRRHAGAGVYVGAPYGWYYPYRYYPYPYYAYPPVIAAPQYPPVYIEKESSEEETEENSEQSGPEQEYYWYHCSKPEGYYPYVKECPNGWEKVTPHPPGQQ